MRTMMVMWPLHSYVHNQERQGALPRMKEDQFFDAVGSPSEQAVCGAKNEYFGTPAMWSQPKTFSSGTVITSGLCRTMFIWTFMLHPLPSMVPTFLREPVRSVDIASSDRCSQRGPARSSKQGPLLRRGGSAVGSPEAAAAISEASQDGSMSQCVVVIGRERLSYFPSMNCASRAVHLRRRMNTFTPLAFFPTQRASKCCSKVFSIIATLTLQSSLCRYSNHLLQDWRSGSNCIRLRGTETETCFVLLCSFLLLEISFVNVLRLNA